MKVVVRFDAAATEVRAEAGESWGRLCQCFCETRLLHPPRLLQLLASLRPDGRMEGYRFRYGDGNSTLIKPTWSVGGHNSSADVISEEEGGVLEVNVTLRPRDRPSTEDDNYLRHLPQLMVADDIERRSLEDVNNGYEVDLCIAKVGEGPRDDRDNSGFATTQTPFPIDVNKKSVLCVKEHARFQGVVDEFSIERAADRRPSRDEKSGAFKRREEELLKRSNKKRSSGAKNRDNEGNNGDESDAANSDSEDDGGSAESDSEGEGAAWPSGKTRRSSDEPGPKKTARKARSAGMKHPPSLAVDGGSDFFLLPVAPGKLGVLLKFDKSTIGAVISAIDAECAFKEHIELGDRLVTIDGSVISKAEDVSRGRNNKVRMFGIAKREMSEQDLAHRCRGSENDEDMEDIRFYRKLPIQRKRREKFDEADLTRLRLYKSAVHPHAKTKIPKTSTNKEGRMICALCSSRTAMRGCSKMCSTCLVPLCTTPIDKAGTPLTCFDLWHHWADLQAVGEDMNEILVRVRAESEISGRMEHSRRNKKRRVGTRCHIAGEEDQRSISSNNIGAGSEDSVPEEDSDENESN